MSYKCLFAIQNTANPDALKKEVTICAKNNHCGVFWEPKIALLHYNCVYFDGYALVFAVSDSFQYDDASMLLSYDGDFINDQTPKLPLKERMTIIQDLSQACFRFTEKVEIFISEDNPYLPDYEKCEVAKDMIASVLFSYYSKNFAMLELPCVELIAMAKKPDGTFRCL